MDLLIYLLKVSACTALFFAFYLLVLKKLTFFKFNRFYLLGALLISFIIPALQFNVEKEIEVQQVIQPTPIATDIIADINSGVIDVKVLQVTPLEFNWLSLIPYTYCIIAFAILGFGLFHLYRIISHTKSVSASSRGLKIVYKTNGFTNCSFFKYVFIDNENLTETEISVLLKHEAVHAEQYHSIDKILMIICKAFLWFNPIVYFFDKELEQTHEYEADLITSAFCGSERYASLLLRLAISKSEMPLVHNFVKSPVKERIKMLFNSKSKEMKKFSYLLSLPIVFCLVWVFAVEVVYAQTQLKNEFSYQDTIMKKSSKNKEMELPSVKQVDPYFSSEDYLKKLKIAQSSDGKTLIGTIKGDFSSEVKFSFDNGKLFESGGQTYILPKEYLAQGINLLKTGSEVKVVVHSTFFNKGGKFVYIQPKQIFSGEKLIFQMPKPKVYPFLYEANKVRFNDGKIAYISSSGNKRIVVVNANGYNFRINVNNLQTELDYLNDYQRGDEVRLRFVHEVKTGPKSYVINDWISISKNLRTFGVQNKILFSKFYKEDGHQRAAVTKKAVNLNAKNFGSLSSNESVNYSATDSVRFSKDKSVISLFGKAKLSFKDLVLEADEITFNQNDNTGLAKNIVLTSKTGSKIKGSNAKFNLNGNVEIWQNVVGNIDREL